MQRKKGKTKKENKTLFGPEEVGKVIEFLTNREKTAVKFTVPAQTKFEFKAVPKIYLGNNLKGEPTFTMHYDAEIDEMGVKEFELNFPVALFNNEHEFTDWARDLVKVFQNTLPDFLLKASENHFHTTCVYVLKEFGITPSTEMELSISRTKTELGQILRRIFRMPKPGRRKNIHTPKRKQKQKSLEERERITKAVKELYPPNYMGPIKQLAVAEKLGVSERTVRNICNRQKIEDLHSLLRQNGREKIKMI